MQAENQPKENMASMRTTDRQNKMPRKFQQHKYNAVSVEFDGIRFDSKKEGRYYQSLKLRVKSGEVIFFLRQTVFHIEGGTYRVDFQEFHSDGTAL